MSSQYKMQHTFLLRGRKLDKQAYLADKEIHIRTRILVGNLLIVLEV